MQLLTQRNTQVENNFFSFDGVTFKEEASSKYQHKNTFSLGSYKDSPFVTGSWSKNLETEILDYGAGEWVHYPDEFYPYTNGGDKYVYN